MQQRVGESQAAVCGTCVRTGVLREANLIRQPPPHLESPVQDRAASLSHLSEISLRRKNDGK